MCYILSIYYSLSATANSLKYELRYVFPFIEIYDDDDGSDNDGDAAPAAANDDDDLDCDDDGDD